jgi:hypothetical protein
MPKQPSGRHAPQPIVPQVSAETWKSLLRATDDLNRLAPWEWMHDSHVIGLRYPPTKEVLLGSILGRMRSVFALLIYRNETGRRWLLNTILNEGDSGGLDGADMAFEQDLLKVEFVPKRDLTKEDRAVLTAASYSPPPKGAAWPQFRSIVPGGYPWHLTQSEAVTLLFALPRVMAVTQLLCKQPNLWDDHCDGEIAFVPDDWDPTTAQLRAEQLDWEPMIPPPERPPETASLDEATMAGLLKLKQAKGFHLELDVVYSGIVVADEHRPRFPKLAMAVDRESGFVGGFHLADLKDRDGAAALGTVICGALTQLGSRPELICVQRPRVAAMVTNLASKLGILVVEDAELPQLNFARQSMEQHFKGARSRV